MVEKYPFLSGNGFHFFMGVSWVFHGAKPMDRGGSFLRKAMTAPGVPIEGMTMRPLAVNALFRFGCRDALRQTGRQRGAGADCGHRNGGTEHSSWFCQTRCARP